MAANAPRGFKLEIASPCTASWEAMAGTDRVRFCGQCKKNVYDLSQMTEDEAHQLIAEREGNVCVRFYVRKDGTVLTQDCPVGLAAVRKRVRDLTLRATGAALALFGAAAGAWLTRRPAPVLMGAPVPTGIPEGFQGQAIRPTPPPLPHPPVMMGEPAMPTVEAPPAPPPCPLPKPHVKPGQPEPQPHKLMGKPVMRPPTDWLK